MLFRSGQTITITMMGLMEGIVNMRVENSHAAPSTRPAEGTGAGVPFTVTVLDSTNKVGWTCTARDVVSGHFNMFQLKLPLKLKLSVPTKMTEMAVPFELKDVPLP